MTNRAIPTSMVGRIDRAISPLSPARNRTRRLTNRRKIRTRAASGVAANKEVRNANGNELLASTSSFCLAKFFRLPIRLLRHFPFLGARCPSVHALRGGSYGTSIFIRQQNLKLYRSLVAASEAAAAAKADARQERKFFKLLAEEVANKPPPRKN